MRLQITMPKQKDNYHIVMPRTKELLNGLKQIFKIAVKVSVISIICYRRLLVCGNMIRNKHITVEW